MRILLINNSPVVGKLVTLSAQKTGDELVVIDNIKRIPSEPFDLLLLDNEFYDPEQFSTITASTDFAKKVLIAERGSDKPPEFAMLLEKPFLPTDLVEILLNINNESEATDSDLLSDDSENEEMATEADFLPELDEEEGLAADESLELDDLGEDLTLDEIEDAPVADELSLDDVEDSTQSDIESDEPAVAEGLDDLSLNDLSLDDEDLDLSSGTDDTADAEESVAHLDVDSVEDENDTLGLDNDALETQEHMQIPEEDLSDDTLTMEDTPSKTSILDQDDISEVKDLLNEDSDNVEADLEEEVSSDDLEALLDEVEALDDEQESQDELDTDANASMDFGDLDEDVHDEVEPTDALDLGDDTLDDSLAFDEDALTEEEPDLEEAALDLPDEAVLEDVPEETPLESEAPVLEDALEMEDTASDLSDEMLTLPDEEKQIDFPEDESLEIPEEEDPLVMPGEDSEDMDLALDDDDDSVVEADNLEEDEPSLVVAGGEFASLTEEALSEALGEREASEDELFSDEDVAEDDLPEAVMNDEASDMPAPASAEVKQEINVDTHNGTAALEGLLSALNSEQLRQALKGMKISINISFDE